MRLEIEEYQMSDWELVEDNKQSMPAQSQSDWELVEDTMPNSMQQRPNETFGDSLKKSIPRVGEDIYRGGMNALKSIPSYWDSAKTEVPGLVNSLKNNPGAVGKQFLAGLGELGQNVFNTPHDIANYATNRLNLLPKDINEKIQMGRMPSDTEGMINQTFGEPNQPGQALARGLGRNALNVAATGIIPKVNPLNMTVKSIAKDVVNTEKQQVKAHNKMYNSIWNEASRTGFNSVPYDANILNPHRDLINKFYPQKSTKMLNEFMSNPLLENAQKAQSDLGNLRRSLEEKARTTPLLETEKDLYDSLSESEKHIEDSMFKNSAGQTNNALRDKYKQVTNSYRENVVPYKYNPAIQAYKNKEILGKELVNSLSHGEFAAKKGSAHPAIKYRNMLKPLLTGAGMLGGSAYLYNEMFGNKPAADH